MISREDRWWAREQEEGRTASRRRTDFDRDDLLIRNRSEKIPAELPPHLIQLLDFSSCEKCPVQVPPGRFKTGSISSQAPASEGLLNIPSLTDDAGVPVERL